MFDDEQWLLVSIILLPALVTVVLGMWLQLALLRTSNVISLNTYRRKTHREQ